MSRRTLHVRGAFTLVELLVVVGIVTVLVALLMPALSKVRKHALEVKCAANLRSMGQAMFMYTQQYRYYPGSHSGGIGIWPVRLRPLLGGDRSVFNCPAQDERFHWTAAGPGGTGPPATPRHIALGYEPFETMITADGSFFTYGYNQWGTGDRRHHVRYGLGNEVPIPGRFSYDPVVVPRGQIPVNWVKVPSDMIAVADSSPNTKWDFAIDGPVVPGAGIGIPPGPPGSIHRGGANVLFCDGHVTWYLQKELIDYSGPNGLARRRRWHNDHEP